MRAFREDGKALEIKDDGTWRIAANSDPIGEGAFRGSTWGSNSAAVKSNETGNPEVGDSILVWNNFSLGTLNCDVVYIFTHDLLTRGKYMVTEDWVDERRYLDEYAALKALLVKKYGDPVSDEKFWSNTLWQDNPNEWGLAVASGHLSLYARWETGDTRVFLYLSGENYESSLGIEYVSVSFEGLENSVRETAVLDNL